MFSASQLSDEEKETIHAWAAAGDQLPEIQKKLVSELGHNVTFMDTRFLVLDLGVEIQSPEEDEPEEEAAPERVATGEVSVTVDELVRPGMMISGRVTFADGEPALWGLDQIGRLSLDADTAGYQPSEEDMMAFQTKLREQIEAMQGQQ